MTLKAKISINRLVQMYNINDSDFFKYKNAMDPFFESYEEMAKQHGVALSTEYGGDKKGLFFVIHDAKYVQMINIEGDNVVEFPDIPAALKSFERRSEAFLKDFIGEHPAFEEFEFRPAMWRMFVY
ncbi:hypothetical protein [Serratia sp. Se-RSBMAAmG]|uniref:hypothetical protein n=1 Tax=Serratia sp. Se-RSBMAAmG TaxID=3043305 RepID=UPI0024AF8BF4|nr:hypothetical protein [Serratia sp. Se-RSBMAAmG]MDI6976033.1 hypothetical protein [Serratia sp. Se-RSBMAAmG]